jgi:hypothetical protein
MAGFQRGDAEGAEGTSTSLFVLDEGWVSRAQ